jgi:hypothetical protein
MFSCAPGEQVDLSSAARTQGSRAASRERPQRPARRNLLRRSTPLFEHRNHLMIAWHFSVRPTAPRPSTQLVRWPELTHAGNSSGSFFAAQAEPEPCLRPQD